VKVSAFTKLFVHIALKDDVRVVVRGTKRPGVGTYWPDDCQAITVRIGDDNGHRIEKERLREAENFSFYMSNFVDRIIERVDSFGQQFSEWKLYCFEKIEWRETRSISTFAR